MTQRPNILWYCTDQQRFDTIGALGNPHVVTPTLDALVADGVAFTHAYCQSPICTPSRSSFMTGMYPSRVHNTRNGNETFPSYPPVITKLIADSGYDCGLIGKFHLQSAGHRTEPRIDDGFSYWKFSHAPRDDWKEGHDYAEWVHGKGGDLDAMRNSDDHVAGDASDDLGDRVCDRVHQPPAQRRSAVVVERQCLRSASALHSAEASTPIDLTRRQCRARTFAIRICSSNSKLAALDFQDEIANTGGARCVSRAGALLRDDRTDRRSIRAHFESHSTETGQRDNTVIIFTSDHGEALGRSRIDVQGMPVLRRPGSRAADLFLAGRISRAGWSATRWSNCST